MRVLVLANCSHPAYTGWLRQVFPGWDVRSVFLPQAQSWVRDGHAPFLDFLDQLDLFVGMTDQAPVAARVAPAVRRVPLPYLVFQGYHPDTVWLHGIPSPMGAGVIQSRIAAAAWLSGLSVADATALFTADHYRDLGYFDMLASETARVIAQFAAAGLDIGARLADWMAQGSFLHTPNHPRPPVFADVIAAGMRAGGYLDGVDPARLAAARAAQHDHLADGVIWPVYPEIAAHHGMPPGPATWRRPLGKMNGQHFDLDGMLRQSWAEFALHPYRRAAMIPALGGPGKVAVLAGKG